MQQRATARALAIAYLVLLTAILWAPKPFEAFGELAPAAEWLIGPGYWVHFALYLVLGLLLGRAFGEGVGWRTAAIAAVVAVHAVAVEGGQAWIPGREADAFDILSNLVGGGLGLYLWRSVHRRRSRASQSHRLHL